MASGIRPLEEQDIPACAKLHAQVFRIAAPNGASLDDAYRAYFQTMFLANPLRSERSGPLVCEENGNITGFLGAIPRPLRFRGRPLLAMLTSQFVVDPASRSLAGVRLLKACMAGPQDLTLADESNDISRSLWERLGGRTAFAHSVHWLAVLRPTQRVVDVLRPPGFGAVSALARVSDAALARLPRNPWKHALPEKLAARPLEPRDLLRFWHECQASLIPDHDEPSLRWTLDRLGDLKSLHGELQAVTLWADNQLAGAYAYHAAPRGPGHVVLFAAQPAWDSQVLTHLLASARNAGLPALTGRVHPRHVHAFSRARCQFSSHPKWTLAHAAHEPLLQAVLSGDDALTAMDGEWLTHFNYRGVTA